MADDFEKWFSDHVGAVDQLPSGAVKNLRTVLYSAWLENAAPSREQVEVLVRQAAGEITGEQARELMRQPRAAAFRG